MWQNLENHMNTFTINGTILTKGHQHSILKIFNSIWLLRFCKDPPPPQQPTKISWKIVAFFFYQGFLSQTLTTHRTEGEERGPFFIPFHSTTPTHLQTFRHLFATLHSCLQQQSTTPETLSFLPPWLPSSSFRCAYLRDTPLQCLKIYMQSPKYIWWRTI